MDPLDGLILLLIALEALILATAQDHGQNTGIHDGC